jgi:hypothetical protein
VLAAAASLWYYSRGLVGESAMEEISELEQRLEKVSRAVDDVRGGL